MNRYAEFVNAKQILKHIDDLIAHECAPSDPWEWVYDHVFCEEIMFHVRNLRIEWVDPDTSYKEDVLALREAVEKAVKSPKRVEGPPNHIFEVNGQTLHISLDGNSLQITSNQDLGVRNGDNVRKHHTVRVYLHNHLMM